MFNLLSLNNGIVQICQLITSLAFNRSPDEESESKPHEHRRRQRQQDAEYAEDRELGECLFLRHFATYKTLLVDVLRLRYTAPHGRCRFQLSERKSHRFRELTASLDTNRGKNELLSQCVISASSPGAVKTS